LHVNLNLIIVTNLYRVLSCNTSDGELQTLPNKFA